MFDLEGQKVNLSFSYDKQLNKYIKYEISRNPTISLTEDSKNTHTKVARANGQKIQKITNAFSRPF